MARVKRGVTAHARHTRLLQDAEGRKGTRSKLVKPARESAGKLQGSRRLDPATGRRVRYHLHERTVQRQSGVSG